MVNGQTVAAVVVAAGASSRMGFDKLLHPIDGAPVLLHAVHALGAHPLVDSLVVVTRPGSDAVRDLLEAHPPQKPWRPVPGGATRAASVAAGVAAAKADLVAIHDAARPFVSAQLITRVVQAAAHSGAAAPAVPVTDTIKRENGGAVQGTVPRAGLVAVQTPQVFARAAYLAALSAIPAAEWPALTDDCMVMEQAGKEVVLVPGEETNVKITTPADLPAAFRVGHGYDVHRFEEGRPLILGGVAVPHTAGLLGHSDADVLAHAVSDAILGAAALGDIGAHFPDTDPAYKDADSIKLLALLAEKVAAAGWRVANVDATLVCQAPKLAPHIPAMRQRLAAALGIAVQAVSVKATTEEGLGFTGQRQGVAAHCVALLCTRR